MVCGGRRADCGACRSARWAKGRGAPHTALRAVWRGGLPRGEGLAGRGALVASENFGWWFCNKQRALRGELRSPPSVSAWRADALIRRGALMFHVKQRRSLSGVVVLWRAPAIQTFGLIRVVATRGCVLRTLPRGSGEELDPSENFGSQICNKLACARARAARLARDPPP